MTNTNRRQLEEVLARESVHYQLSVPRLVEKAIAREEGVLAANGAFSVSTGKFTGRSPKDKYIVYEPSVADHIAWGSVNQEMSQASFDKLYEKVLDYLNDRELFVFDGFAGTDPNYRLPIRIVNEYAWHNLFVHQLFIRPTEEELTTHSAEFTILAAPGLKANPSIDGIRSDTFIAISFEKKVVLIGGTEYAGEMKKSIFSVLNYVYPFKGIFPMHCSSNIGVNGDVALFFGLSGTGKTTLSADPDRHLIGDDEHGWTETGVFNFEGGCYAKCIGLSREKEPQIWEAIRFGSVLENVVLEANTGKTDYNDNSITENTRAAYPIEYISGARIPSLGGHPEVILFLTADASGVLPPIAKLNKDQAMYHFLSGYTSKLAGTERGVTEPEVTFSACFGAPFLPLRPSVYAELLGKNIEKHRVRVYLVNTGWSGGAYGTGKRMNLAHTRAMVTAAINGSIEQAEYNQDPIFGFSVPSHIQGVPNDILIPKNTWENKAAFDLKASDLATRFAKNFEKFDDVSEGIRLAGPSV
nr:phosphoenolpyruvate carboxykinase (ATP) [Paenibacillus allorhizoplanae]